MSANRSIDKQIAVLMGYSVIVSDTYDYWYYSEKYKGEVPIQPFSISWEAMRLLVEWLQGKKIRVELDFLFNEEVSCELSQLKGYGWDVIGAERYAKSAPLALCKAVLALPPEVLA